MPSREEAKAFLERSNFVWYQRFRLAEDVYTTPDHAARDVDAMLDAAGLPHELSGRTVLDIGTANGAVAFEAERRGADRIVATDVFPADHFGFTAVRELLGSHAEYVQASVYELPGALEGETFDLVLFLGVLYHLRHPLLGLEAVRDVVRGEVVLETAVADRRLDLDLTGLSLACFYRRDELEGDASNWFLPTLSAVLDWCSSTGLDPTNVIPILDGGIPERCIVWAKPAEGEPEYTRLSYEEPLQVMRRTHRATD